jgi:16S rRNA (guanine527-N7)-methyltransferase
VDRQIQDLVKGCAEMDLSLENEQIAMFSRYLDELLVWNRRVNLVSRRHTDQIAVNHFLDCLSLLGSFPFPPGAMVMDVGSGAGLPGLPLKIMRSDMSLVLVEATQKKALFLKHVTGLLGLSATQVFSSRAEDMHGEPSLLGRFDVVVARAVASLEDLVKICFPFLKKGGCFVAFKGGDIAEEMADVLPELPGISGNLLKNIEIIVPISHKKRRLVLFTKP